MLTYSPLHLLHLILFNRFCRYTEKMCLHISFQFLLRTLLYENKGTLGGGLGWGLYRHYLNLHGYRGKMRITISIVCSSAHASRYEGVI